MVILAAKAQEDVLEKLKEIAVIDEKVMMPMRDGIKLATDIFRPKTDERIPVIFVKTPYNFNPWRDGEMHTRPVNRVLSASGCRFQPVSYIYG
jgi:predicted acyl esterase